MSDWHTNSCGGVQWRTLPGGLVEVEGQGVAAYSASSAAYDNLARTWSNWSSLFRSAASRYGIPVSWVVAIATNETGAWANDPDKQASIISFDQGVGIMQITKYPGTSVTQMLNPRANIETGAMILRKHADRYGLELPACAAAYNAGGVYCSPGNNQWNFRSTGDYSGRAVMFNNAALMYLKVNQLTTLGMLTGGAVVSGIGIAAWKYWQTHRGR